MTELAGAPRVEKAFLQRFGSFVVTRYSPLKYLPYCGLWVMSLQAVGSRVMSSGVHPGALIYLRCSAATFLILLFMRVVDELKDLDFDRVHNPTRAFASGRVPLSDAPAYLALIALAVTLLLLWHTQLLVLALAIMAYSLLLLFVDRHYQAFANSMFPNIALAVQLKTLLVVYVLLSLVEAVPLALVRASGVVAAYLSAYLHWEILRKIQWPSAAKLGDRLYSREAGVLGSFLISAALLLVALGLVQLTLERSGYGPHRGWALMPAAWLAPAAWRLFRDRDRPTHIGVFGLLAYVSFLAINLLCSA